MLTLQQAIRKLSAQPAARLGLHDRGRLGVGMAADVVVFDPIRIADTATFEQPFQYPVGLSLVVVNGAVVLRDGARSDAGPGKSLRSHPIGRS